MWVLFLWLGFAVAVGVMAANRGRSGFGWFLLALTISPLLASIFLLIQPDLTVQKVLLNELASSKKCPHCAELIKREAIVCRYCGRDVESRPTIIEGSLNNNRNSETKPFNPDSHTNFVKSQELTTISAKQWSAKPRCAVIAGNGRYQLQAVGESQYQDSLEFVAGPRTEDGANFKTSALLLPEPNNAYDPEAVCLLIEGKKIGYLDRQRAREFNSCRKEKNFDFGVAAAKIVGGWDRGGGDEGFFGVKLDAALPFSLLENSQTISPETITAVQNPRNALGTVRSESSRSSIAGPIFGFLVIAGIVGYAIVTHYSGKHTAVLSPDDISSAAASAAPPISQQVPISLPANAPAITRSSSDVPLPRPRPQVPSPTTR